MTVRVKEFDGRRSLEIECKDGVVYIDDGRKCYGLDAGIFLHAVERELGVMLLRNAFQIAAKPCGGSPAACMGTPSAN
jgi:hypothetical protein